MRKRRGREALAASLITRRLRRSPSLAYAALPAIRPRPSLVTYLCMYICAVLYSTYGWYSAIQQHSQKKHRRILQLHHHQAHQQQQQQHTPATPIKPCPIRSLSRRMRLTSLYVAISQYRVCTVLYVPYRAVGVSICKKHQPSYASSLFRRSQRPGCDIAVSGSGWPTVLGRLVEHNLASAVGRRPLVSHRRHAPLLLLLARSRDRSRPDRLQRASQAHKREQSKQSPGTGRCG